MQRQHQPMVRAGEIVAIEALRRRGALHVQIEIAVAVVVPGGDSVVRSCRRGDRARQVLRERAVAVVRVEIAGGRAVVRHDAIQVRIVIEVPPEAREAGGGAAHDRPDLRFGHLHERAAVVAIQMIRQRRVVVGEIPVQVAVVVVVDPVPDLAVHEIGGDRRGGDALESPRAVLHQHIAEEIVGRELLDFPAADEEVDVAVQVVVRPGRDGVCVQGVRDHGGVDVGERAVAVVHEQTIGVIDAAESVRGRDHQIDERVVVDVPEGRPPTGIEHRRCRCRRW